MTGDDKRLYEISVYITNGQNCHKNSACWLPPVLSVEFPCIQLNVNEPGWYGVRVVHAKPHMPSTHIEIINHRSLPGLLNHLRFQFGKFIYSVRNKNSDLLGLFSNFIFGGSLLLARTGRRLYFIHCTALEMSMSLTFFVAYGEFFAYSLVPLTWIEYISNYTWLNLIGVEHGSTTHVIKFIQK